MVIWQEATSFMQPAIDAGILAALSAENNF